MVYIGYLNKGELNSVWKIAEGDTKFMYTMKFVPLEYLGIWEPKVLKCRKLSMQGLSNFFVLGDATGVSDAHWNEDDASLNSPK